MAANHCDELFFNSLPHFITAHHARILIAIHACPRHIMPARTTQFALANPHLLWYYLSRPLGL